MQNYTKTTQDAMRELRKASHKPWFGPAMVAFCFLFLLGVRLLINLPTFGDEPHYLIMDSSLVKDGDLNLKNNYENKDYQSYFPDVLAPQGAPPQGAAEVHSIHGDGLPVFLLPGFVIAGKWGAVVQMLMLATAVVWLTWVWTRQLTKSRKLAYLAAGMLTICYFFSNLAGYIYPDMPLAAVALLSLVVIEKYYRNPRFQLLLGLILGFLVLIHFRTLILVLPVLCILTYKLWRAERRLPWMAYLGFSIFGGYYYYQTYVSGTSFGPSVGTSSASLTGNAFVNASAMLFDSNKGLFAFNPLLLLLVVGLPIWFKQHRESLIISLLITLPTIATTVMFIEWHGGYAPTGRYMVSVLPVFIPALAFAISKITFTWQRVVVGFLTSATLFVTLDAARSNFPLIDPNLWTRHRLFEHIQHATGIAIDRIFPAFITSLPQDGDVTTLLGDYGAFKLVCWYTVVAGLFVYGYYLSTLKPVRAKVVAGPKKPRKKKS